MKKTGRLIEINEQCHNPYPFNDLYRQSVFNKVVAGILTGCSTEDEASGMFFWRLADLEPPVSRDELLLFRALYLIYSGSQKAKVENTDEALGILGIPKEKIDLPKDELIREIKVAYWKYFNEMSRNLKEFYGNAREIAIKKSAFDYICRLL